MDLRTLQELNRKFVAEMKAPFRSGSEVILALTEELGEVAQEIALLEQVGSKAEWRKQPSVDRLAVELGQLLNLVAVLANVYNIDLTSYVDG